MTASKRTLVAKVSVVASACALTWSITSSLMAQQRSSVIPPVTGRMVMTGSNPAGPGPVPRPVIRDAVAAGHFLSKEFTFQDGVATVKARASIFDKRAGVNYIWRLRVLDSSKTPVAGRVYSDQIFSVDADGTKEAEFVDAVALPPGAARVELVLYEKPVAADLSFLDDDVAAKGQEFVRISKPIK